jgi:hypothetical protein
MSVFSDAQIEYLGSQRLGRLATVGQDGMPHVVPVAFRYNPDADTIDTGGKAIMDGFDDPIIRITPTRIVSWGLEGDERQSR